jgi:hypothetical protein
VVVNVHDEGPTFPDFDNEKEAGHPVPPPQPPQISRNRNPVATTGTAALSNERMQPSTLAHMNTVQPRRSTRRINLAAERYDSNIQELLYNERMNRMTADDASSVGFLSEIATRSENSPDRDDELQDEWMRSLLTDADQQDDCDVYDPAEEKEHGQIYKARPLDSPERLGITRSDMAMAKLYKVCDDAGAPRYLGDKILETIRQEIAGGFNIHDPLITKRDPFFLRNKKKLRMSDAESTTLRLDGGQHVTVRRFNFRELLQEHLLSPSYSSINNLCLDQADRWNSAPHVLDFSEVHTSSWYINTYKQNKDRLCNPKKNYILHPLVIYVDKTGTDKINKNSVEPVVMSSTILKNEERRKSTNWFVLGYIPNLNLTSSAMRNTKRTASKSQNEKTRDYHRCLQWILEPLLHLQKEKPAMIFRRGDQEGIFRIIAPLAMIMGDNLSNDVMCCRRQVRSQTAVRMTRRCLTTFQDCDESPHLCHQINSRHLKKLTYASIGCCYGCDPNINFDETRLHTIPENGYPPSAIVSINFDKYLGYIQSLDSNKRGNATKGRIARSIRQKREWLCTKILKSALGSHSAISAYDEIDFGSNRNAEHLATATDIMHTVEEGLFKHLLSITFDLMTDDDRKNIDIFVQEMFCEYGRNRSGERNNYPRVSFTRGFSKLTLLSADERVGQVFVLSILLHIPAGRNLLQQRFNPLFDKIREARAIASGKGKKGKKPTENEIDVGDQTENVQREDQAMDQEAEGEEDEEESEEENSESSSEEEEEETEQDSVQEEEEQSETSEEEEEEDEDYVEAEEEEGQENEEGMEDELEKNKKNRLQPEELDDQECISILRRMDLDFITEVMDGLPEFHKEKIWVLVKSVAKKIRRTVNLPQAGTGPGPVLQEGILDYKPYKVHARIGEQDMNNWLKKEAVDAATAKIKTRVVDPMEDSISDERQENSLRFSMDQFAKFVETNLAFHSLLKYGSSHVAKKKVTCSETLTGEKEPLLEDTFFLEIQGVAEYLRAAYKHGLKRTDSQLNMKLQKLLEWAHFVYDLLALGPAGGYNTDTGERGLKLFAKRPAKTAQKRSDSVFTKQICRNSVEMRLLNRICQSSQPSGELDNEVEEEDEDGFSVNSAHGKTFVYKKNKDGKSNIFKKVGNKLMGEHGIQFPESVTNWFDKNMFVQIKDGKLEEDVRVEIFTQLNIKKGEDTQLVRAHPNHCTNGPWFDYVGINYKYTNSDDEEVTEELPARCACFFFQPYDTNERQEGRAYMLVQESEYQTEEEKITSENSLLFADFSLEGEESKKNKDIIIAKLQCQELGMINCRMFCIDPEPNNGGAFWKKKVESDRKVFPIVMIRDRQDEWVQRLMDRFTDIMS